LSKRSGQKFRAKDPSQGFEHADHFEEDMPNTVRRQSLATLCFIFILVVHSSLATAQDSGFGAFRDNSAWSVVDGTLTLNKATPESTLVTRGALADSIAAFDYRAPPGARATLYVHGRYGFVLEGNGDWQSLAIKFRGARFDAGYQKLQNAMALEARNGTKLERNVLFEKASAGARWEGEDSRGPNFLVVERGPFTIRDARFAAADFSQVIPPTTSGGETNEKSLVDTVALGKETFESVGCSACHLVETSDTAVSSGPNLFGLFRAEPRAREVEEGEGHRFQIKAGREYLHRSLRAPADQLAVAEIGAKRGEAYPPAMPPFSKDILSDAQIDAIGDYLATLNVPGQRGPAIKLATPAPTAPYDPLTDSLQWLVDDEVRIQRGALPGVSARSIHVGRPNGVHYTFDPRRLAIVKIWQGGFLDLTGELTNRGGKGVALGHESREISFGDREHLLAPLDAQGKPIDFSFKEAKFGDTATIRASLYDVQDQLTRIRAVDAQFLGYSRDSRNKLADPAFKYRVGANVIEVATSISARGEIVMTVTGVLKASQSFTLHPQFFAGATVSTGTLAADRWTLPSGRVNATLRGKTVVAESAWRPTPTKYSYKRAPLTKAPATAALPAGYSIENYYPPKDNYGREQLFEALGLALTKDDTLVVGTRTAGIWRLVKGEWRLFAEGLFDNLGVVAEDDRGLTVVAGQKPELTRISDTNGDGIADEYETLFDAHSFHGNYHTYMHGPVRGPDGSYYIGLNLAHDGSRTTYNAGGDFMGTWGGFSGWVIRVRANGKFELFANGVRSPASLGIDPAGRLWYADNQGEYVGTSKLFAVEQGRFYGHPSGLVDLSGMTPDSPEITWDKWADRRAREVILFPHNRVANSPGNPVWVTRDGFGPFTGQMLVGDQTQSNLLRVSLQKVGTIEQGSVMPFFAGLESGVMRPVFMRDGSLLLGQTGRGWQAKGGKVASLQHVRWDGKTIAPGIVAMLATSTGFRIDLTQPLAANVTESSLRAALTLESWTYRDAPDYGSDELDLRSEAMTALTLGADRKTLSIALASLAQTQIHPQQTGRVYHAKLATKTLFDANAPEQLDAYYTLHKFPAAQ
jgi:mono/diheme cytochrome c family protein